MSADAGDSDRLADTGVPTWSDGSWEATARVVDPSGQDRERQVEAALRPRRLSEFPGQTRVRDQLALVLEAARRRGTPPDHVLLSGPPGLGKTTLAMIIAAELEQPIRVTSGPAIQHAGDLASILSSLAEGEVLFLDEIHRMSRAAEEMLYLAMEDFRVDIIVGKGPGATAIPLELPPFTVVGATTRSGLLPVLRRVRDWAQIHGQDIVDLDAALQALALFDVDVRGLDRLDRAVLDALCRRFGGGPVGVSNLAVAVGEEADTVETVAEPFLVREGLIVRTSRGRAATALAWDHLGLTPPSQAAAYQASLLAPEDVGRLGS